MSLRAPMARASPPSLPGCAARAEHEGIAFQRLVFPQYQEESSALLRMYLNGEFGRKPAM